MGAFIGALWCEEARYTRFVQRGREWAMVSIITDQFSHSDIIYNFNSLAFYVPQPEREGHTVKREHSGSAVECLT